MRIYVTGARVNPEPRLLPPGGFRPLATGCDLDRNPRGRGEVLVYPHTRAHSFIDIISFYLSSNCFLIDFYYML